MQLAGSLAIGRVRLFLGVKDAEMVELAVTHDLRPPILVLLMPKNALQATGAVFG